MQFSIVFISCDHGLTGARSFHVLLPSYSSLVAFDKLFYWQIYTNTPMPLKKVLIVLLFSVQQYATVPVVKGFEKFFNL